MQAFLGSPELKEEVLLRIKQDQNLDRILQEISLWDDKLRSMWMPILPEWRAGEPLKPLSFKHGDVKRVPAWRSCHRV